MATTAMVALFSSPGCKANAEAGNAPVVFGSVPIPLLSEAEVKAKYQNCPGGYYSGPRPGKKRFAQDPWIWVVTPEFAKRFCMPAEFVSAELQGAEAVAFRVLRKADSVNCGYANNPAVCFGEPVIRFDVYVKSDSELPRRHKLPIYHVPEILSMKMISRSPLQRAAGARYVNENPMQYGYPHFEAHQVSLQGVKAGSVEWPITTLDELEHRAQALEGIDYYSFEGLSGAFQNPRMLKLDINDFQIMFERLGVDRVTALGSKSADYAYAIKFPIFFSLKMLELDITQGRNFSQEVRRAFSPGSAAPLVSR